MHTFIQANSPLQPQKKSLMKALLFGSIGTVCETSPIQLAGYNAAFKTIGLDWFWTESVYRDLLTVTGGQARLKHYAQSQDADLSDTAVTDIHTLKTQYFTEQLQQGLIPLRPGVSRLVLRAREYGARVGFITTTEPDSVSALLENCDALSHADFDLVTTRGVAKRDKPNPDVYNHALHTLGLDAREAIAIEDTADCVSASVAAGIATVATPHAFSVDQSFASAASVVTSLGDEKNPGRHKSGIRVVKDGIVTIASLRTLLTVDAHVA